MGLVSFKRILLSVILYSWFRIFTALSFPFSFLFSLNSSHAAIRSSFLNVFLRSFLFGGISCSFSSGFATDEVILPTGCSFTVLFNRSGFLGISTSDGDTGCFSSWTFSLSDLDLSFPLLLDSTFFDDGLSVKLLFFLRVPHVSVKQVPGLHLNVKFSSV